ncbi:MAG TPA: hypothetical protein VFF03_14615 [Rhodocyclaceae bacterium]|nr:hypothetical protein [Rhodocyclaceae bacterium]
MRPHSTVALLASVTVQLVGCSYGYRATATLDGHPDSLQGKAELPVAGGGRFHLSSPNNDLVCDGYAEPPESPSSEQGCRGEHGSGSLRCSDGRTFLLSWKAITCRAFEGTGRDREGHTARFSVTRQHP